MIKYKFKCEYGHTVTKVRTKPYKRTVRFRCPTCGMYMYRDLKYERKLKEKASLQPKLYQERKLFKSGWIEKLVIT